MRTVIVLAIGIYLGRQLYVHYDLSNSSKKQERIRQRLIQLLKQNGLEHNEAKKKVNEAMKD